MKMQIKMSGNTIRDLTGENKKQNDLKGQKQKIKKSLRRRIYCNEYD